VRRSSNLLNHLTKSHFSTLRRLNGLCGQLLGTGEGKVSDELIALKNYASSLASKEPGNPYIVYNPDYTALAFRGRILSLAQLHTGLNELIKDSWHLLLALSGGHKIKVEFPPLMSEDLRSINLGETFIKGATTEPPTLPLLFEMLKRSNFSLFRPSTLRDGAAPEVDPSAAQEFLHAVTPIVEALAFLVHITGSGPLRLSEVVDDRYCNGSSPRNLLISHGLVFLLRRNLKSSTTRGYRSSVIHFPPEKVVELLTYYLAVVRPVEVYLTARLGLLEQLAAYSQFLYVVKGKQLTPQRLSTVIAQHTGQYFLCRLTGLNLRHVLISLQSVFLPPLIDPSVQKFRDSQAGHNSRVANHVYGQRIDHLPGEEAALFVLAYHWCKKFHSLVGLGPEASPVRPIPYLHAPPEPTWWSPSSYIPPNPPSPHEIMNQVRTCINSVLPFAAHEFKTQCEQILKELFYQTFAASSTLTAPDRPPVALPLSPTPGGLLTPPSSHYTVGFVLFISCCSDSFCLQSNPEPNIPEPNIPEPSTPEPGAPKPTTPSATVDDQTLLHALSLYTKRAGSTFTSDNQRLLLEAALTGEHDSVLAVLPTGSGKSIAIFGPPLVETTGISVVITCYAALRFQLAEQARSFGIKHLVWSNRGLPGSPDCLSVRLVIMMAEDLPEEDARVWVHFIFSPCNRY
jgi:hypothetical protein